MMSDTARTIGSTGPTSPGRIKGFVKYFNSYVASIFVAAIPAPLSQWSLMPVFEVQRGLLTIATPIFCFLTLAFLFFMRDALAGPMFPLHTRRGEFLVNLGMKPRLKAILASFWRRLWAWAPLAFIGGPLYCASQYYFTYGFIWYKFGDITMTKNFSPAFLEEREYLNLLLTLPLYYIFAFVLAEAAFVWMALKEYIQDVLGITDLDLISRKNDA
jgi:hypothetical protein